MAYLDELIYRMEFEGVRDILIPFILIFTVVYAVLQKAKIFGDDEDAARKFNTVISLIMALGVVFPHVLGLYGRRSVVDIINSMIPQVSMFVVAVVMLMLMIGVWGKDVQFAGKGLGSFAVFLSIVILVMIFINSAGWYPLPDFLYFLSDPDVISLVVIILVFGLIIWFITAPSRDNRGGEKFGKKLIDAFNVFGGQP